MSIKINIGQVLQRFAGNRETVEVQGKTVAECLDDLVRQYPDIKQWIFDRNGILMVLVMLNGESVYQKKLKKRIADGDELTVTFIVGGG